MAESSMAGPAETFFGLTARPDVAAGIADPRPVVVFDGDGTTAPWANAAGAAFFGATSMADLVARRFPADTPVARDIAHLAETLPEGAPQPRRLRFFRGLKPVTATCRCTRITEGGERLVIVAMLDVPALSGSADELAQRFDALSASLRQPAETDAAEAANEADAETPVVSDDVSSVPPAPLSEESAIEMEGDPAASTTDSPPASISSASAPVEPPKPEDEQPEKEPDEAVEPVDPMFDIPEGDAPGNAPKPLPRSATSEEPAAADAPVAIVEAPAAPLLAGQSVRFVFELDAEQRFAFVSPAFAGALGPSATAVTGLAWTEAAARFGIGDADRVTASLARRDTFSGVTVRWPVDDVVVPVDLAGMPSFGRDRRFLGWRGFGVCRLGAAEPAPVRAEEEVPPSPIPNVTDETSAEDEDFSVLNGDASAEEAVEPAPDAENAAIEAMEQPVESPEPSLPDLETASAEQTESEDVPDGEDSAIGDASPAPSEADASDAPALGEEATVFEPAAPSIEEEVLTAVQEDWAAVETPAPAMEEPEGESLAAVEATPDLPPEVIEQPPAAEDAGPPRRTADIVQSPIVARPTASWGAVHGGLSKPERDAFRQIAEALGARYQGESAAEPLPAAAEASASRRAAPAPAEAALLDRLPVATALLRGSDVLSVNRALLALAGLADRATFDEAGGISALFGDFSALSSGAPVLRRADGTTVPVEVHLHSVTLASGAASMLVIRGGEAPAEPSSRATDPSLAELETVLDTATDGVLMLDERATIVGANRSAEALFGYERSDLIGQPLTKLLAQESHRAALDYVDGLTKNGVASVLNDGREVIGEVQQGGLIPLFMTIGRISATKFCAVLRDITNWKRAEEELVGARRAAETASSQKSDFLAKISHEVRTPLNAIIGFSEVMMEERFGPVGSERYREYLRDIHMSGTHIMSLVNDLLDLSKIEAGKLDLAFEAVSLNDVVNECVALMQPQANRERIIIRTSLASNLPDVVADQRSLRQIVLNLLSNGIKFTPNGGQVIVSTQYEDTGEAVVRVRDTGVGMSREDVERALEPFRQLHTSRGGRGTGLGLPLTKALVEANRAHFRIDSAVDHGTLVQVTFPSTRVLAE
jgi:PAS domain S-box-containing protein